VVAREVQLEPEVLVAGVGQPGPGVDALAADQHVGAERGEGFKERLGLVLFIRVA
jgi:hypothetical protein